MFLASVSKDLAAPVESLPLRLVSPKAMILGSGGACGLLVLGVLIGLRRRVYALSRLEGQASS